MSEENHEYLVNKKASFVIRSPENPCPNFNIDTYFELSFIHLAMFD